MCGGPCGTANLSTPPRPRFSGGKNTVGEGIAVGVTNGVAVGPGVDVGVGAGVALGGIAVGAGSSGEQLAITSSTAIITTIVGGSCADRNFDGNLNELRRLIANMAEIMIDKG